jgi:hypothetical protein
MRSNRTALALALLLVPPVALAYRPFDGTDAAIADPGIIEIELGPASYVDLPRGGATELPVLTLNAGASDGRETVIDATRTITRSPDEHDAETFEAARLLERILRHGVIQERTGWSIATEFGVLPEESTVRLCPSRSLRQGQNCP